jgi:flagellar assembly protein FliH
LDKDALMRRVERAAAMFNRADDDRVIRMHPEDLSAIQSRLPKDWEVQGDSTMERGAIRVESRSGGIETGGAEDGPEQWRRAIIAALDIGGLD